MKAQEKDLNSKNKQKPATGSPCLHPLSSRIWRNKCLLKSNLLKVLQEGINPVEKFLFVSKEIQRHYYEQVVRTLEGFGEVTSRKKPGLSCGMTYLKMSEIFWFILPMYIPGR